LLLLAACYARQHIDRAKGRNCRITALLNVP
jgi:hypothetical protein